MGTRRRRRADDNTGTRRKQLDEGIGNALVSGAGYGPVLAGGRKEQVTPRHSRTIKNQNRNIRRYRRYLCAIVFLPSRWFNRVHLLSARKDRTCSRRKQQSSPERSKESAPGSLAGFGPAMRRFAYREPSRPRQPPLSLTRRTLRSDCKLVSL